MEVDKPSLTALSIAASHCLMRNYSPFNRLLAKDQIELSEALMQRHRTDRYKKMVRLRKYNWVIKVLAYIQGFLTVPGLSAFHACRKLAFEELTRNIIEEKKSQGKEVQVVALAAGFDTLLYRLSKSFPEISFFETDHPATQKWKREMYEELNFANPNHTLVSCDYTKEKLNDVLLRTENFKKDIDTIFLAEGLMFYLPREVFDELLAYTKQFVGSQSYMIFTFMQNRPGTKEPGFHAQGRRVKKWLANISEPFLWGRSKTELESELQKEGYEMLQHYDGNALRDKYLAEENIRVAVGEDVCSVTYKKA